VKQIFPCEGENNLSERCLLVERTFLGLIMADVICLAYQHAAWSEIKNQFCKSNEKTGWKWLKKFLSSHQEISVANTEVLHSQERGVSLLKE
jgi:hypothetical protein